MINDIIGYTGVRPQGVNISNWGNYFASIWHSIFSNGKQKPQETKAGTTTRERQINGKASEDNRNQSGRDRTIFQNTRSYVERIAEAQERLEKRKLELNEFIKRIQKEVMDSYTYGGTINYIPCEVGETIEIADGWKATLDYTSDEHNFDLFICLSKKGTVLAEHNHFQIEHMITMKGKYNVKYHIEEVKDIKNTVLSKDQSLRFDSYSKHEVVSLTDSKCMIIFSPRITIDK